MKSKLAQTLFGLVMAFSLLGVFTQSCYADDMPPPVGSPPPINYVANK